MAGEPCEACETDVVRLILGRDNGPLAVSLGAVSVRGTINPEERFTRYLLECKHDAHHSLLAAKDARIAELERGSKDATWYAQAHNWLQERDRERARAEAAEAENGRLRAVVAELQDAAYQFVMRPAYGTQAHSTLVRLVPELQPKSGVCDESRAALEPKAEGK